MSLLGTLVCAPKPTEDNKKGNVARDPHVEKALSDTLATYFNNSKANKHEPFYEN